MASLPELLNALVSLSGSDLHLTTNSPPLVRVHGKLQTLDLPVLGPAETKALAYSVLTDAQKKRFEESLELDFSFGIRGLARFRCNVFNQRGAVAAVYRLIPETIRSFADLGLPPVLATLSERPRGLVLVTTLGTGIGSALVHDGRLVPSSELGHLELDGHVAEHRAANSAREREELTMTMWAERLTRFYRHLERLFSPDLFVVGGGISKKADEFLPLLRLDTEIVPATLRNRAGIVGAALEADRTARA